MNMAGETLKENVTTKCYMKLQTAQSNKMIPNLDIYKQKKSQMKAQLLQTFASTCIFCYLHKSSQK